MQFFNIIQLIIILILSAFTLYLLVFSFASIFYFQKKYKKNNHHKKIAVLIPGYKEDVVIVEVAKAALNQSYPSDKYDVVIIADSFQQKTIENLTKLPIKVVEVSFEKSTKSKALNKGMEQIGDQYDIAVILDADNIMEFDFLDKINNCMAEGYFAVQGHRTAKNTNNSWAVLDAISEEINNTIFRKGHRVLGLSSAIIGSGMAFQYAYFKKMMINVKAVGGFDKEIELLMLKEKKKIMYLDNAIVYDEKVQKSEVFGNQRRRWLSAQFHYFRKDIMSALKHLFLKGNLDYFDKAIQFIQPPRILLLGVIILSAIFFSLINVLVENNPDFILYWIMLTIAVIIAFVLAVPSKFYGLKTIKAIIYLPYGMVLMMLSLLKIKGANKTFIHTEHTASTSEKDA